MDISHGYSSSIQECVGLECKQITTWAQNILKLGALIAKKERERARDRQTDRHRERQRENTKHLCACIDDDRTEWLIEKTNNLVKWLYQVNKTDHEIAYWVPKLSSVDEKISLKIWETYQRD